MSKKIKIVLISIVGIAVFLTIISAIQFRFSKNDGISGWGNKIGLVQIYDVITTADDTVEWIEELQRRDDIVAVLVDINTPGGSVGASQEIYQALRNCRDTGKLVIASLRDIAASGGYYIALGCDKIFSDAGTITGSIGVIFSFPDLSELSKKIGVDMNVIKSGSMKDAGSSFREMEQTERIHFQAVIDDVFEQFVEAVSDGRKMKIEDVKRYSDGRIFSGRQAHSYGLVDTLGTRQDAISFIAKIKDLGARPVLAKKPKPKLSLFELFMNPPKEIFSNLRGHPTIEYRMP